MHIVHNCYIFFISKYWWFSSYLLVQKENYWSLSFRGLLLVLTPLTRSLNFLDVIADTITGNTMKGHYQTSQSVFFRPSFLNYNLMSINVCSNIFNFISFKLHKIVDAKIANWNMDFKLGILPVSSWFCGVDMWKVFLQNNFNFGLQFLNFRFFIFCCLFKAIQP